MSHLDERQLFTSRYGIGKNNGQRRDREPWARRHGDAEPVEQHRCICPGPSLTYQDCALRCTQEDSLCDECRLWCFAVDSLGRYHHFITLGRSA